MIDRLGRLWGKKEASELRERMEDLERENERLKRRIKSLNERGEDPAGVRAENLVWIFGAGRTGSTWLARMLGELTRANTEDRRNAFWNEPWVGTLFDPYSLRLEGPIRRKGKGFILSRHHEKTWLKSLRMFVLDGAAARFPDLGAEDLLVIKEPGGSAGAPLLMAALPESRMVLLVRDPRDVVASQVDAHAEGAWMAAKKPEDPLLTATSAAERYARNVAAAKTAYEAHTGPKTFVRYEELRRDTLGTMNRVCRELGMDDNGLEEAVEKHAWKNVPQEEKGAGKFYRKATSGGWREDLTPEQVRAVEKITAPFLEEFYP